MGLVLMLGQPFPAWGTMDEDPFLRPMEGGIPPMTSSSRRFIFRKFHPEDSAQLAVWMEQVVTRLEARTGIPVPFNRFEAVRVDATAEPEIGHGSVHLSQVFIDEYLQQRMTVTNPEQVQQEMLLEGLVKLFLNRYIVNAWKEAGPGKTGMVLPDWFSAGLAQSLMHELVNRNRDYVTAQWHQGEILGLGKLASLRTLPAGRVADKAWCGELVFWLSKPLGERVGWGKLIQRIAEGKDLDMAWVTRSVLGMDRTRDAEKRWDLHLATLTDRPSDLGRFDVDAVIALKKSLHIHRADFGIPHRDDIPARLEPADLIRLRDEDWVSRVCIRKRADLKQMWAGQAVELVAAADRFDEFFRILLSYKAARAPGGTEQGPALVEVEHILQDAQTALDDLEKRMALQSKYIENVEDARETLETDDEPPADDDGMEILRQQFLDSLLENRTAPD